MEPEKAKAKMGRPKKGIEEHRELIETAWDSGSSLPEILKLVNDELAAKNQKCAVRTLERRLHSWGRRRRHHITVSDDLVDRVRLHFFKHGLDDAAIVRALRSEGRDITVHALKSIRWQHGMKRRIRADGDGKLPPPPPPSATVSRETVFMAGLEVDVFGLRELLAESPLPRRISCLWLFHGRLGKRDAMADIARQALVGWYARRRRGVPGGMIAVAFDQRNHGSRLARESANGSWRDGNSTHAIDMFSMVTGMVADTRNLMDLVEGYVLAAVPQQDGERRGKIEKHLVLGFSLGGHCAWQILFADPRVTAGVMIVSCPDYMSTFNCNASAYHLSPSQVQLSRC